MRRIFSEHPATRLKLKFVLCPQERAQKAASWADIDALAQDFLRGVEKGDYAACGWPQTCACACACRTRHPATARQIPLRIRGFVKMNLCE